MMKLGGKVALVTGGAVRIGRAICIELAKQGAHVVIHYNRSLEAAKALRNQLKNSYCLKANLTSEQACRKLVDNAIKKAGQLDILVNNAAVFHKNSLRAMTAKKIIDEFRTNLIAPMLLTKAFAEKVKRGKIVNLLDRRITSLDTSCLPYVLSKKALAEFTRMAALELAPGFTVNAVAPGAILPPPGKGMDYLRDAAGPIPLQRQCTPEDVAAAVIGLLENDAITGQIVFVDGGQHLLRNGAMECW